MKQSLIKRARSVAIFSLKLKERRAREAEKQAYNLAEQEKVSKNWRFQSIPLKFILIILAVDFALISKRNFEKLTKLVFKSILKQAMNPQPPGGELDMIGIEQLIQIDDIHNKN